MAACQNHNKNPFSLPWLLGSFWTAIVITCAHTIQERTTTHEEIWEGPAIFVRVGIGSSLSGFFETAQVILFCFCGEVRRRNGSKLASNKRNGFTRMNSNLFIAMLQKRISFWKSGSLLQRESFIIQLHNSPTREKLEQLKKKLKKEKGKKTKCQTLLPSRTAPGWSDSFFLARTRKVVIVSNLSKLKLLLKTQLIKPHWK